MRRTLFIIGILFCYNSSFSQNIIKLNGQKEVILPLNSLEFFEDSLRSYGFKDILAHPSLFKIDKNISPRADYNATSAYWIRLSLDLPTSKGPWILEFYDQTIDHIEVYQPSEEGDYKKIILGDKYIFNEKPLRHKNFEIVIEPHKGEVLTYYAKIESHEKSDIRIAIRTFDRFVYYSLNEYFLYGIFYGMILIISLYNLLIYAAIREVKYLYYTFYIISVGLFAASVDGIAYQYLWPAFPEWNQIAHGVALFFLIFWALLFAKAFLNTEVRVPVYDKWLNIIIGARVVIFLYSLLFDHQLFQYRNIEIIPLSFVFYLSVLVFTRGYKPARFFVAAYGFLFLGFFLKALLNFEIIPFSILTYYTLHICFLIEMLLLTFALSDRVRILKNIRDKALKRTIEQHRQNEKLKDKINRELEAKIKERTVELEQKNLMLTQSNHKLQEQAQEISRMNSLLGKDNWKLQKNIKEVLQDRLFNKNLTYKEFSKIFPDELSCHRFLDKLKWDKGYHCYKCHHNKFSDGKTKFSRRCSRCGYEESVTSHTLFHGIKFPIEKAFYILYMENNKNSSYTLDALVEILELRKNTIWSFRKKIRELIKKDSRYSGVRLSEIFVQTD